MSFPFAKSNDYESSSRGALLIRWPGVTMPGRVDRHHLVSTLDFAPTLLDAAGLPPIPGVDGRSFLPAVKGETMAGWDRVFAFYNAAYGNNWLPMRCLRTRDRAYIWNAWSDGRRAYHTENKAGLTWKAMLAAASTNPSLKARTDFHLHRVPEEFYDLSNDRCERANLIGDPARRDEIEAMRSELLALMRRTGDPFAEAFEDRGRTDMAVAVLENLKKEHARKPDRGRTEGAP
jgi:N-sulfoglucosamine sulfohydrolase